MRLAAPSPASVPCPWRCRVGLCWEQMQEQDRQAHSSRPPGPRAGWLWVSKIPLALSFHLPSLHKGCHQNVCKSRRNMGAGPEATLPSSPASD